MIKNIRLFIRIFAIGTHRAGAYTVDALKENVFIYLYSLGAFKVCAALAGTVAILAGTPNV